MLENLLLLALPLAEIPKEHDPLTWGVSGLGWEEAAAFTRLPDRAQEFVREPVWRLSRDSAGVYFEFKTDATDIAMHVELRNEQLDMVHMPATGVSGVDLYAKDGEDWRWVGCGQPRQQTYTHRVRGLRAGEREYRLYLPLYNGVSSLRVEVPEDAAFEGIAPSEEKPLVYYGTSIIQGACVSRPGMALPAILGRRLDMPTINLGFSGNAKMEPEVAELLAELDPAIFVIDALPNMNKALVGERAVNFVRTLREARPYTPILLMEDRRNANSAWFPSRTAHHDGNHAALREAYETLVAEGFTRIHYVADAPFLGEDGEATVDGSHPTDLGMMRYADVLVPLIQKALEEAAKPAEKQRSFGSGQAMLVGDLDGGGKSELLTVDLGGERGLLFRGEGGGIWKEVEAKTFLDATARAEESADHWPQGPTRADVPLGEASEVFIAGQKGVHRLTEAGPIPWEDAPPALGAGHALATFGDLDGDGRSDVVVATTDHSWSGRAQGNRAGTVVAVHGQSGEVIWQVTGDREDKHLGHGLASPGDVNGDGAAEVVTASHKAFEGALYCLDGRTGERMWSSPTRGFPETGRRIASGGDWDGDGVQDIVTTAYNHACHGIEHQGVVIVSGKDGQVLTRIELDGAGGIRRVD